MGEASRMTFPLPVILRSGSDEGSFFHGPGGGMGEDPSLCSGMTMGEGAQDDRGVVLRGTKSDAQG